MSDNNSPNPSSASTPLSKRAEILGELWISYKTHPKFKDYVDYCDLGLPLAYSIATDIVSTSPKAETFINEAWEILLDAVGVEDIGFEDLEHLFSTSVIDDMDMGFGPPGLVTDQ